MAITRNDPTGEKRKHIFWVVNLAEGFQGEATEQQHQTDGGADSAGHGSSSPALGRWLCQNPACPGLCRLIPDISFAFHITHLASAAQERAPGSIFPPGDRGSWDLLVGWGPQFSICRRNETERFFLLPNSRTCRDTHGVSAREEKQNWVSRYTGFQLYLGTTITWEALPTACSK